MKHLIYYAVNVLVIWPIIISLAFLVGIMIIVDWVFEVYNEVDSRGISERNKTRN